MEYNDFHHILRTTAQWNDRSMANISIERGVLCIELTPDGQTKIKIGEGNKYYRQLPYVGGSSDLSNYYTKEQVDHLLAVLNRMAVASTEIYLSYGRLPKVGNKLGDVRFVRNPDSDNPLIYLWNNEKWIPFSEAIDIDLSEYAKKSEVNPRLKALERDSHTHRNKSILDATTASYTIEEKEKLAELHNYKPFTGATSEHDGTEGLVPAPTSNDRGKFLAGDGTWKTVSAGGGDYQAGNGIDIDTEIEPNEISVKLGNGLEFNENGEIDVSQSYVAGEGISIDEGEQTRDITSLVWENGSLNGTTGEDDNTDTTVIRSPYIEAGLTASVGVSAMDGSDLNFVYKVFFYDSNHILIRSTPNWLNYQQMANKPDGCKYIRILLSEETHVPITTSDLSYCELSYPIEIGKYVITNTGVTHIEMNGSNLVTVENGETENVLTFGSDFTVNDGTVQVADWNRLILNVTP